MTFGVTADEELEQYEDFDGYDDPGFDLRGGGTDLFRAVLVLLIAAAVGALILSRGFGDTNDSAVGSEELATESLAGNDTGAVSDDPASPATDATVDESMADDSAATGDAMTNTDDVMSSTDATEGAISTTTVTAVDRTTADGTDNTDSGLDISDGSVARDPREVEVLVLNATDRKGIAAQASDLLQTSNYNTAPAANATVSGIGSVIYYMESYRADAVAVAQVFTDGLEGLIQPYDPARPPATDIGTAKVIVVLGIDEAIPIG
ncbi:MAG: LytR C-terminal domain-containing protein [Acidimicrobiia bacterium]|nr:LytR C-terminal domain-containing protein [Acidimicrobiia bacterium]